MELKISRFRRIRGQINVPGDKSISHRAVILGSISTGTTEVHNFLLSQDTLRTVKCLQALGIKIKINGPKLTIEGGKLQKPRKILNAGNSGTTARLLMGVLAGQEFSSVITGDASLRARPMNRVIFPLKKMGAELRGRHNNYLPVAIKGKKLQGIKFIPQVASAQVKSSLLLAGLAAQGTTSIKEPCLTRDHSERMLAYMGARIKRGKIISIKGKQQLKRKNIVVPADISSAAYFIALAILLPHSAITIPNVGINPTRTGLIDILKSMGAKISIVNRRIISNEPVGKIKVKSSSLKGVSISGNDIPGIIDELPLIAVLATQAQGITLVRNAEELRVKESDRIQAIVKGLSRLGARIEELKDGFKVTGPTRLKGNVCRSYGDHRIAMSLAVAGCIADSHTRVKKAECIDISFPEFSNILQKSG
ncbi:MAG: 3-phosphoshikimate 1-carboxyvinyltransferase [Planctomycetes bacterium]|nr:3-phosphoshikimate 1-carboxyvinyltransferase [Planctomycetota bacterium]